MSNFKLTLENIPFRIFSLIKNLLKEYKVKRGRSSFLKNRRIYWLGIVSLFFNVLLWIFILWRLPTQEDLIPLHYNIYFGVDLIGKKNWLLELPVIGLFILLVNFLLGFIVYKEEKNLSYILLLTALVTQLMLVAVSFLISNI